MDKRAIFFLLAVTIFSATSGANDPHKDSGDYDAAPKITFNWPSVQVESVKYHLARRFIKSDSYLFPILIKEKHQFELIDGREGTNSNIELEMWELDVDSMKRKVWSISREADVWEYLGWDELVFIKYGCCSSPNRYHYYNLKTGAHIKSIEGMKLPEGTNRNE